MITDRRRVHGFSLIETLAALAIFSIAIVGIIQGIAVALGHWRSAEERTHALMLAENVMEELLYNENYRPGEDEGEYDPPDDIYRWFTSIEETETAGVYAITAGVSWGMDGHEHSLALNTLRTERDRRTGRFRQAKR